MPAVDQPVADQMRYTQARGGARLLRHSNWVQRRPPRSSRSTAGPPDSAARPRSCPPHVHQGQISASHPPSNQECVPDVVGKFQVARSVSAADESELLEPDRIGAPGEQLGTAGAGIRRRQGMFAGGLGSHVVDVELMSLVVLVSVEAPGPSARLDSLCWYPATIWCSPRAVSGVEPAGDGAAPNRDPPPRRGRARPPARRRVRLYGVCSSRWRSRGRPRVGARQVLRLGA